MSSEECRQERRVKGSKSNRAQFSTALYSLPRIDSDLLINTRQKPGATSNGSRHEGKNIVILILGSVASLSLETNLYTRSATPLFLFVFRSASTPTLASMLVQESRCIRVTTATRGSRLPRSMKFRSRKDAGRTAPFLLSLSPLEVLSLRDTPSNQSISREPHNHEG